MKQRENGEREREKENKRWQEKRLERGNKRW